MDTALTTSAKPIATAPVMPTAQQHSDTKITAVTRSEKQLTRPAEKPFVEQIVTARLSGIAFPENPAEIVPAERSLRPYGTPMLPAEKPEPIVSDHPNASTSAKRETAAGQPSDTTPATMHTREDQSQHAITAHDAQDTTTDNSALEGTNQVTENIP